VKVARYGVETKTSPEEIIRRAMSFFGQGGVGLEVSDCGSRSATFVGGGGHVLVHVSEGEKTEVELVTREWDYDVKRFMRQIA
jgi:hypothetical protein